jgi:hypothetical protein
MTNKDPYQVMWTSEVTLVRQMGGPVAVRYQHFGPVDAKIDEHGHLRLERIAGADFEILVALHLAGTFTAWAQEPNEEYAAEAEEDDTDDEVQVHDPEGSGDW